MLDKLRNHCPTVLKRWRCKLVYLVNFLSAYRFWFCVFMTSQRPIDVNDATKIVLFITTMLKDFLTDFVEMEDCVFIWISKFRGTLESVWTTQKIMRMHKIRSRGACIHWLKIFYPIKLELIKNYTYIVFSVFILQYTLGYTITGHMCFLIRPSLRKN